MVVQPDFTKFRHHVTFFLRLFLAGPILFLAPPLGELAGQVGLTRTAYRGRFFILPRWHMIYRGQFFDLAPTTEAGFLSCPTLG